MVGQALLFAYSPSLILRHGASNQMGLTQKIDPNVTNVHITTSWESLGNAEVVLGRLSSTSVRPDQAKQEPWKQSRRPLVASNSVEQTMNHQVSDCWLANKHSISRGHPAQPIYKAIQQ